MMTAHGNKISLNASEKKNKVQTEGPRDVKEEENHKAIELTLNRMHKDYIKCIEADQFQGKEEREIYENSNGHMETAIHILKCKEADNPFK